MTITITAFERSPDGGKGLARDTRVRWALEEVEQAYDVRLVSFAQLKGPGGRVFELRIKGNLPTFLEVLRGAGMECTSTDDDVMRVFVPDALAGNDGNAQRTVFALAAQHGVQVRHLRPSIPTLEDVFAKALGEK